MEETEIKHYPNVKQSWGIVGVCILSMFVFAIVHVFLSGFIGAELSFLVYYLLSMGYAFWFAHNKRRTWTNVSTYNFDLSSVKTKTIILVSITVIAIQIGIISPMVNLVPMPEFMKNLFIEFSKRNGVFSFITIVIAAPILEELIFRGVILDGLLKKYSPAKSILISSILFGVVHLNPWQFITALILGSFSGWLYYKTNSLTLSILIHFVNNLAAFSATFLMDPEDAINVSLTELYGGLLNLALIIIGAVVAAIICIYFLRLEITTMKTVNAGTQDNA